MPDHPGSRFSRLALAAFVFGLGWLVRPDMALVTVVFGIALWLRVRPSWRRTLGALGIAAVLPVGYEIFRAGYYGVLVPMPAISKNASSLDWPRGWAYFLDFVEPYRLWIALAALVISALFVGLRLGRRDAEFLVPPLAAIIAGLLSMTYVIAIGGDFMHGRMLLPGTFLLVLPVALVPWGRALLALCCALGVWAVVCAANWRPSYEFTDPQGPHGIADERQFYVDAAGDPHPDASADYFHGALPTAWTDDSPGAPDVTLYMGPGQSRLDLGTVPSRDGRSVTVVLAGLGYSGAASSLEDVVVDDIGLSYPLAAHAELTHLGEAGHDKNLPLVWVLADLTAPTWQPDPQVVDPADLAAARKALSCGALAQLQTDVRAPMTPDRFWHNLLDSYRNTELVVPADPNTAVQEFCR